MILEEKIINKIAQINKWTKAYDEGHPIISDKEWDDAYFELEKMEKECNVYLEDSPTQKINYQVISKLKKVHHNHLMLSLEKTKDINEVESFLNDHDFIAMCKMDGLTCSLRYLNGKLVEAETRGNGIIGEDILHNALTIRNIPKKINYKEELIIDGEVICKYDDFIPFEKEYKNPRNFSAGSIRLLDSSECRKRKLTFIAWDIIKGFEETDNLDQRLEKIDNLGFTIVPFEILKTPQETVEKIKENAKKNFYPIDGIVFKFLSKKYGDSLGKTDHHFKNAIAYKFYDETYQTALKKIEWTMGRTGILTPVAVFDPVEIDGSIVSRASLHNVSILKEILGMPYSGQEIEVYKSNMIIPQILSAKKITSFEKEPSTEHSNLFPVITKCPICGQELKIYNNNDVEVLKCINEECEGQLVNRLDHYCGKKGLDIKGFSKATIEKLINWGWLNNILDIYSLYKHKEEWKNKTGFGEKSVTNILNAIEESKTCELWQFLSSMGIPLIGVSYAKEIAKREKTYESFRKKVNSNYNFLEWFNFGYEMLNSIKTFDYSSFDNIVLKENINIKNSFFNDNNNNITTDDKTLKDIVVAITGKLLSYPNRQALKEDIEKRGGKVVENVSSKTTILINNDKESTSSKNKTAKQKNIPILTEEEFIEKFFDL